MSTAGERVRLDRKLLAGRVTRHGGAKVVAQKAGLSEQTLRGILYSRKVPSLRTLLKLCHLLGLAIPEIVCDDIARIMGRAKQRVVVFVGAHREAASRAPTVAVSDLDAASGFMRLNHGRNVRVRTVLREKDASDWHGFDLGVVIGSVLANPIFAKAWETVQRFYEASPVRFIWPPPPDQALMRRLQRAASAGFVRIATSDWGIECPRLKLFLPRDPNPSQPSAVYHDVAVVAGAKISAQRYILIAGGHGCSGTIGACHLLREHWERLEDRVCAHGAVVLLSPVLGWRDEDTRPFASIDGQPVYELLPDRSGLEALMI